MSANLQRARQVDDDQEAHDYRDGDDARERRQDGEDGEDIRCHAESVVILKGLCREPDLHGREDDCRVRKPRNEAVEVVAHERSIRGAAVEVPTKLA